MSDVEGSEVQLKTTDYDKKHYPATNQAHYCWQKYNEFVLCVRKNGGNNEPCADARQLARSLCPTEWTEEWDTQRQNGTFLGIQEKAPASHGHKAHH